MKISNILPSSPMWFKLLIAKLFIRCLTIENAENDIILYTELRKWIETHGRPTTSNINYHINNH